MTANVDWGQGVKQLKTWLDENAPGRRIRLGYFGSVRPEYYGIDYERIPIGGLERPPGPGLHALSTHRVARTMGRLGARHGEGAGELDASHPSHRGGRACLLHLRRR